MARKKSGMFDQSKYIQQYMKENVTVKKVSFNKGRRADAEMLKFLDGKPFSTYVKDLIWRDMIVVYAKQVLTPDKERFFCPTCGNLVESEPLNCPDCGQLLDWSVKYL